MNGKAAKRLRIAVRILAPEGGKKQRMMYQDLKTDYKAKPFHERNNPFWQSHSSILKERHKMRSL